MVSDLQKASLWKRIAAGIFDGILLGVLAVGFAFLLSLMLNYDGHNARLEQLYAQYESAYGVEFNISQEQYNAMTDAQRQNYDTAYKALIADAEVQYTYNLVISQTLLITTIGILMAVVALEFVVPLCLKNGQTLGKKIFGIGLMRTDGVRMNTMQLFTRTILGKYTIEIMVPVYLIIMIFFNSLGLTGTVILGLLLVAQIVSLAVTNTNAMIHDLLAGTVAVDISSQMIFRDTQDLIDYQKRMHAERAARASY